MFCNLYTGGSFKRDELKCTRQKMLANACLLTLIFGFTTFASEIRICCRNPKNNRRLVNCSDTLDYTWITQKFKDVYTFARGELNCTRIVDIPHEIQPNSSIYIPIDGKSVDEDEYCVEPDAPKMTFETIKCATPHIKILKLPKGVIFSLPILLAACAIQLKVSETGNAHKKSFFNYIFSLMCTYLVMGMTEYVVDRDACYSERRRNELRFCSAEMLCSLLGYVTCYFSLSFTFWLNTMCIELYRIFG